MSQRTEQLASTIQHELGFLLLREVELPAGALVTITSVEVAPDMRHAKVWLSILPTGLTGSSLEQIRKNAGRLQYLVNERLTTKPLPRLHFAVDDSERHAVNVEELLDRLKE